MRLILTGATGLLGNNIARQAVEAGHTVVAPVRNLDDPALADLQLELVSNQRPLDQDWDSLLHGADAIVHSAALIHIGWHQQEQSREVNVEWTRRLAEAAYRVGCRFIHVSTVDTLGYSRDGQPVNEMQREPTKPRSAYVTSKTLAEQVVLGMVNQGLHAVVVHPGFMLGPWDWKPSSGKMMLAIAKRQIPLAPRGGCSVVDVRDVARGVLNAIDLGTPGENFILAGHNLSYQELFQKIAKVVGSKPPPWRLGPVVAGLAGAGGDLWAKITGRESELNSAMVQMGQLKNFYTSEKAERVLGYRISPLEPALTAAWDFLRSSFPAP